MFMVASANICRVFRVLAISSLLSLQFVTDSQCHSWLSTQYTTAKARAMSGGYFLSRRDPGVDVQRARC